MNDFVSSLGRLLNGFMQFINVSKKKRYSDDSADAIANGDRLRESESSYSDLARKSRSDSTD